MPEFVVNDVIEFFPTDANGNPRDNWPRVEDGETYGYGQNQDDVTVYGGTIGRLYDNVTIIGVAKDTLRRGDIVTIEGVDYTVDALRAADLGVVVTDTDPTSGESLRPHIDPDGPAGPALAEARLVPVDGGETRFFAFLLEDWQSFVGQPLSGEIVEVDVSGMEPVRASRGEFVTFRREIEDFDVLCFVAGTRIATETGEVPIEDLKPGDLVRMRDGAHRPIRWIGKTRFGARALRSNPNLRPIRIAAGALGKGCPSAALSVSRQHRILVQSAIAERMFGTAEVLLPAHKLLGRPGVEVDDQCGEVEYWHMLFEDHEVVLSNGALTESLFTGPEALKAVSEAARREIEVLFPQITQPDFLPKPAGMIPASGRQMKRLVWRHTKNNKPLQAAIAS